MKKLAFEFRVGPLESPTPYEDLGELLKVLLQSAILVSGLLVFGYLVFGGIRYMTAGGDEKATMAAKNMMTNAIIGLIIVISAYGIAVILEKVFGISIVSGIKFPGPTSGP